MASRTQYSDQEVLNRLYGSRPTQYSVQEVVNLDEGFTPLTGLTVQQILNRNLGVADNRYSEQQAFWHTLEADLGLTGPDTAYSVQELLNMAYAQEEITLPEVTDDTVYNGFLLLISYT